MALVHLNSRRGRRHGANKNGSFVLNWHREILSLILLAVFCGQLHIQRAWLFEDGKDEVGIGLTPHCPSRIDTGPLKEGLVCIEKCSSPSYNTLEGMGLDPNERVKISMTDLVPMEGFENPDFGKYRVHFPEESIDVDLTGRLANEIQLAFEGSKDKKTIVEKGYIHARSITERLLRRIVAKLLRAGVLNPSKSIVNAGSWIGDNALPWALMLKNLRPKNPGKVIAIDPSENFVKDMVDLAHVNGIDNLCAQIGVLSSIEERVAFMGQSTDRIMVHTKESIDNGSMSERRRFKARASWLNAVTLDSLNLGEKVSLLHLDVESHEGELLQGARATIHASRPIIITEGYNAWPDPVDENDKLVLKVLGGLGYTSASEIPEEVGGRGDARNRIWWPDNATKIAAMKVIGKELERETISWVTPELPEVE